MIVNSQDSHLSYPQQVGPQHVELSTTAPLTVPVLVDSQDVDQSPIVSLKGNLQPSVAVRSQTTSAHDAEQPPPDTIYG